MTWEDETVNMRMKVQIFTTGGTIDKDYFDALSEYQVGHPMIETILRKVNVNFPYRIDSLLRKDSLELTVDDRAMIRERAWSSDASKILITHGTDTMVETGKALRNPPGKTVVLTGALKPAGFQESDAVFNIGFALGCLFALEEGVYICMNGQCFPVERVRKNRTESRFEAIE
jgi:L-asparaginase